MTWREMSCCYLRYWMARKKRASSTATEDQLRRLLANNVRRLRALRDLTQEQAASRSRISYRMYQRIEAAGVSVTLRTLGRLCLVFDVPVGDLFKE